MQPNQRRSNLEVIADILRLGAASKSQIMYSSNMSYAQIQRYLHFLVDRGFMERVVRPNPGVKYHVTQRGRLLLKRIESVHDLLEY